MRASSKPSEPILTATLAGDAPPPPVVHALKASASADAPRASLRNPRMGRSPPSFVVGRSDGHEPIAGMIAGYFFMTIEGRKPDNGATAHLPEHPSRAQSDARVRRAMALRSHARFVRDQESGSSAAAGRRLPLRSGPA